MGTSRSVVYAFALLAAAQGHVSAAAVGVSTHSLDVAEVERYASVGFRVARTDLAWSHVVWSDGEHWQGFDAFVAACLRARITPLLILQWDRADHVSEPAALAEFARFAGVAAQRYPGAIFEVLNEPNLHGEAWPYVEPEDYERVASVVGAAIRANSQRAQVIGPGLGGGSFNPDWLARAIKSGLLAHLDALSVHPYAAGSPEGAPAYYDSIRSLMGSDERPIVVSEWGFLGSEQEQASAVARAIAINAQHGIGLTVVYRWQDAPGHPFGLTREDGTEKLGAAVVRALLTGGR